MSATGLEFAVFGFAELFRVSDFEFRIWSRRGGPGYISPNSLRLA